MNDVFFSTILFMIMIPILILLILLLATVVKCMEQEINELKEELEQHKQFVFTKLSDNEWRFYRLEEALELKEYYDDASRNKK